MNKTDVKGSNPVTVHTDPLPASGHHVDRVDIKTGWLCNNHCIFCVQGRKREIYGNKSTDEVKRLLEEARQDTDSVVFTGGEVTIRKDLIDLVKFAKSLGFRRIQIQTNGRMLAYKKLCEDLIDAGANEFSPALHGHTPELHDYLVSAKGAFRQTVRAIRNLRELDQLIMTNTVIVKSNFRHLPEIARLLVALQVDQFQLAMVHPLGTAAENFYRVVPRFALLRPYLHKALKIGIKAGVIVMTEAVPYCFMQGLEPYVAERIMPRTKIMEGHLTVEDYTVHRLTEGKMKGPQCKQCIMNPMCEGPWREYPEHYGFDEFIPIRDTKAMDPEFVQEFGDYFRKNE